MGDKEKIIPVKVSGAVNTQTIVIHIDKGRAYEGTDGEKTFFEQTDFDIAVKDFCNGVIEDGGEIVNLILSAVPEYLVAFIMYFDREQIEFIKRNQSSLAIPSIKPQSLKI